MIKSRIVQELFPVGLKLIDDTYDEVYTNNAIPDCGA